MRFWTPNVLDQGIREVLAIVIDTSIPGGRVAGTLEQLANWRGKQQAIRVDNGPEYISQLFADWCRENDIELRCTQPGKPIKNAFTERFNRTYRRDVLDTCVFDSLNQVRQFTAHSMKEYNDERPHESLGHLLPNMFRRQLKMPKTPVKNCTVDGETYVMMSFVTGKRRLFHHRNRREREEYFSRETCGSLLR